jgi:prevent-host-death family protein
MTRSYSIAKARDQLARIVHRAERGQPVELTRHGKPVAIVVSKVSFERLVSKDRDFVQAVEEFRETHDMESLNIDPGIFEDVRDKSPGRKVRL